MPTNYYKRQSILQGVLKGLSSGKSLISIKSLNPHQDQRAYHKMIQRRGESVGVHRSDSSLIFKRRK